MYFMILIRSSIYIPMGTAINLSSIFARSRNMAELRTQFFFFQLSTQSIYQKVAQDQTKSKELG